MPGMAPSVIDMLSNLGKSFNAIVLKFSKPLGQFNSVPLIGIVKNNIAQVPQTMQMLQWVLFLWQSAPVHLQITETWQGGNPIRELV